MDPERVILYNMTLGQAIEAYPELVGIADVVVDYAGPSLYSSTESCSTEEVRAMGNLFIKQNHKLKI